MSSRFSESVVEYAALARLESLGYAVKHGPEIAPGELFAEWTTAICIHLKSSDLS